MGFFRTLRCYLRLGLRLCQEVMPPTSPNLTACSPYFLLRADLQGLAWDRWLHHFPKASAGQQNAPASLAALCHQTGCVQLVRLAAVLGALVSLTRHPAFPREAPTVLVSRVDICSEVQEALQAGQALGLLTGQVQGAALVDLSQEAQPSGPRGSGSLLVPPAPTIPLLPSRLDPAPTRSLRLMSAPWRTSSSTMSGWFRRTAMCRAV